MRKWIRDWKWDRIREWMREWWEIESEIEWGSLLESEWIQLWMRYVLDLVVDGVNEWLN